MKQLKRLSIILSTFFILTGGSARADFLGTSITANLWNPDERQDSNCKSTAPISVTVRNISFKRVARVRFDIEVWLDGNSISILQDGSWRTFDRVVSPFSSETLCYTDTVFESLRPENPSDWSFNNSIKRSNIFMDRYSDIASRATVSVKLISIEYR